MTVRELIAALTQQPLDSEVKCWLPGSRIKLAAVFRRANGEVMIEGNVEPGSMIERAILGE
jgi:hypothetical protein